MAARWFFGLIGIRLKVACKMDVNVDVEHLLSTNIILQKKIKDKPQNYIV